MIWENFIAGFKKKTPTYCTPGTYPRRSSTCLWFGNPFIFVFWATKRVCSVRGLFRMFFEGLDIGATLFRPTPPGDSRDCFACTAAASGRTGAIVEGVTSWRSHLTLLHRFLDSAQNLLGPFCGRKIFVDRFC